MKTRTFAVAVAVLVMAFLVWGCAGHRSAELNLDKPGVISHKDTNFGLLTPSIGPVDLAVAYSIKKEAEVKEMMILAMVKQGGAVAAGSTGVGKYLMVLQNNDLYHNVFMWHPEIPTQKIKAKAGGGYEYFTLRDIPEEFVIYDSTGKILNRINPRFTPYFYDKIAHKKQFGVFLVDLIITINKVNDSKIN